MRSGASGVPALDGAGLRAVGPEDEPQQLGAPRADQPGNAEDFALRHGKRHVAHRGRPCQSGHAQGRRGVGRPRCACRALRTGLRRQFASDHGPDQRVLRDGGGGGIGDQPAVAQHDDAIGDARQFVEPVRDVDHGHALAAQRIDAGEQCRALVRAEHGGRFVEHQHPAGAGQRAGDLDHLAVPDAEHVDGQARVEVESDPRQRLLRLALQRAAVDPAAAARQVAEEEVFGHRQRRHHAQLLQHHAHAEGLRVAAGGGREQVPGQRHRPGGRRFHTAQDFGQGALARAVLAGQGQHLARVDVEIDVTQHGRGIVLAEGGRAQQRRARCGGGGHGGRRWRRLAGPVQERVTRLTGVSITPPNCACGVFAARAFSAVWMPYTACWPAC